jgi:hypothetical protein
MEKTKGQNFLKKKKNCHPKPALRIAYSNKKVTISLVKN